MLTRFSTPVSSIALVIESADPSRVDQMGLELIGAARARDGSGALVDATLLVNGTQVVAIYPVVPDPRGGAVAVRVDAGGTWRLTGVLGGAASPAEMLASLSRDGVVGATARVLATSGPGATATWVSAPGSVRATGTRATARSKKSAATKTAARTKTAAKKTTTRKSTAKKTTGKRTTAPARRRTR